MYDEALDLLTCAAWDGDLQAAKTARSTLATLLRIQNIPSAKKGGVGGDALRPEAKVCKADEIDSYESLVRSTGY